MLLPITTDVLVGEARRLGADGHRYSARQLYYAACRAVERPPASITRGFIGLGAILIVLAGAVLWVHSFPLSLILAVIGVVLLLAAPLNGAVERGRARRSAGASRVLADSYDGFVSGPLEEARHDRPEAFAAMIDLGSSSVAGASAPPETESVAGSSAPLVSESEGAASTPLIVCDRRETADVLAANAARLPQGVGVVDLAGLLGAGDTLAPALCRRPLVAVHDAGPSGCAVAPALREAGAVAVVDAGLRPPASDAGLQVIEGAPARLPAGVEADLTPMEAGWLRSGRRLEVATLTPGELIALVTTACPATAPPGP